MTIRVSYARFLMQHGVAHKHAFAVADQIIDRLEARQALSQQEWELTYEAIQRGKDPAAVRWLSAAARPPSVAESHRPGDPGNTSVGATQTISVGASQTTGVGAMKQSSDAEVWASVKMPGPPAAFVPTPLPNIGASAIRDLANRIAPQFANSASGSPNV